MSDTYSYVVHLRVEVVGPDADWTEVAERLARRVTSLRQHDGFAIVSANVDQAADPDAS